MSLNFEHFKPLQGAIATVISLLQLMGHMTFNVSFRTVQCNLMVAWIVITVAVALCERVLRIWSVLVLLSKVGKYVAHFGYFWWHLLSICCFQWATNSLGDNKIDYISVQPTSSVLARQFFVFLLRNSTIDSIAFSRDFTGIGRRWVVLNIPKFKITTQCEFLC